MRRYIGDIEYKGKRLKYYVFGNQSDGFGVKITETRIEEADQFVSKSLGTTLALAKMLRNGSVFPSNLNEILEDFKFGNEAD